MTPKAGAVMLRVATLFAEGVSRERSAVGMDTSAAGRCIDTVCVWEGTRAIGRLLVAGDASEHIPGSRGGATVPGARVTSTTLSIRSGC